MGLMLCMRDPPPQLRQPPHTRRILPLLTRSPQVFTHELRSRGCLSSKVDETVQSQAAEAARYDGTEGEKALHASHTHAITLCTEDCEGAEKIRLKVRRAGSPSSGSGTEPPSAPPTAYLFVAEGELKGVEV